ncbi:MAG: manganese efflux pump [Candidatus Gastranaerophilales bacterium]|nr:manganese efflux pump [Candidatus Gastranaerophilales bacterium]
MSYSEIILLALALSIDACVVSFSYGLCTERRKRLTSLALAITTGFFQAFMPVIAYFFTDMVKNFIQPYSKYIVFIIFMYLGITFIKESFQKDNDKKLCVSIKTLLLIGIATSIDAFSAGISLSLTNTPILFSASAIGIITFANSLFGYWSGCYLKIFNPQILEIIGGLTLIGLAVKTFV